MARQEVMLLDLATDGPVGRMEKLAAHREGRYHTAISVLIFDAAGRQLVQRRAAGKYHGAGLWANACCSHPLPDEPVADAALRRSREELGIAPSLRPAGTIRYRARVPTPGDAAGGLIEHEHVSLFTGIYDGDLAPDPAEVDGTRWLERKALLAEIAEGGFVPWFALYMRTLPDDPAGWRAEADYGYFDLM
jgi:isopentenyl-diphosphate delta-isomerase